MRVLVCGGRDFQDRGLLYNTLDKLDQERPFTVLIHGCAKGADSLAEEWQYSRKSTLGSCISIERFPADWNKYGKRAGFIRNTAMLNAKPDLVVAFPGGRGTANMVKLAKDAGVEVIEIV